MTTAWRTAKASLALASTLGCASASGPGDAATEDADVTRFARAPHLLYVDFDGRELARAPAYDPARGERSTDDATEGRSSKVAGKVGAVDDALLDRAARDRIVARVRKYFSAFDVEVTTTEPAAGKDHTLVVVGSLAKGAWIEGGLRRGEDGEVAAPFGIAGFDCGDRAKNGVAIVLADVTVGFFRGPKFRAFAGREVTEDDVERAVAVEIAHEAGHTFGLRHLDTANSIMHYWVNNIVAVGDEDWLSGPVVADQGIVDRCGHASDTIEDDGVFESAGPGRDVWESPRDVLLARLGARRR